MKGKPRILIVDDDESIRKGLTLIFQKKDYETITAGAAAEALNQARSEQPDLVILDVMLPDMSGIEVCRRLRSNVQTAHLPILMLSGRGMVVDKVAGLKAGGDDYVPKPVDPTELVARVEALLLRAARTTPSPEAQMLAFVGAKGGVGATTVAVNFAVALIQQGKTVILVDMHPYLGCVCPMLGLDPPHGLMDLAQMETHSIRSRDIERRLASHFTGLRVLGSDQSPILEEHRELTPSHTQAILETLSTMADWVIFDLPAHLPPASLAVLGRCRFVALVTEADPVALRCAKGKLALLQQRGVTGDSVGVVIVNRSPSMTMTVSEVQDLLGAAIVGVMPPATEACLHALSLGVPLLLSHTLTTWRPRC